MQCSADGPDQHRLEEATITKHNVHYGDIANPVDEHSWHCARLVVVTMGNIRATRRMVGSLREFFPRVPAMTAVQYLAERDELSRIGAVDVVALAPEGTLSFGRSLLARLGIGPEQRETIVDALESNDYAVLRNATVAEAD